jgi:hypothetical protein
MGATVVLWMRSRIGGSALVLSVLAFLAGLAAGPAAAQNYSYFQGLEQRGNETLVSDGPEMLGHKVSLYTGALEFVHTDGDLPGNSNLKVALTRSYKERGTHGRRGNLCHPVTVVLTGQSPRDTYAPCTRRSQSMGWGT